MYKDLVTDGKGEYNTPKYLFNYLNTFFKIELDPCADPSNYLNTKYYFTKEQDGLEQEWRFDAFVNPPYGIENEIEWIEKAMLEHDKNDINIFLLLPNKTEAPWFSKLFISSNIIIFPQQRINFLPHGPLKQGKKKYGNIMGSVIFGLITDPQEKFLIGTNNKVEYVTQGIKKFFFPRRNDLIVNHSFI